MEDLKNKNIEESAKYTVLVIEGLEIAVERAQPNDVESEGTHQLRNIHIRAWV
jgi:hypothetical protein